MKIIRKIGKYAIFYLSDPRNLLSSEIVGTTGEGLKFLCLRENLIERTILEHGVWEPLETNVVKTYIQPGSVVFDIGANIGYFSLLMSKQVGCEGQVHCFEPTSYAFNRLQKNLRLNDGLPVQNLKLNNQGLSSRCEHSVEALESRFSSRLLAYDDQERIEFITLDHYIAANNIDRVDFMKIDVDGYDYEVIKGGEYALRTYRPIVMAEMCSRVLRERGIDVNMYLDLYAKCGYTVCQVLETAEVFSLPCMMKDSTIHGASWNVLLS